MWTISLVLLSLSCHAYQASGQCADGQCAENPDESSLLAVKPRRTERNILNVNAGITAETLVPIFKNCASMAISGSWTEYGYADDPRLACWKLSDSIRKMQSKLGSSLIQESGTYSHGYDSYGDGTYPWGDDGDDSDGNPKFVVNEATVSKVFGNCASYAISGSWAEYGYADDPKVACWAISDFIRKMYASMVYSLAQKSDSYGDGTYPWGDDGDASNSNQESEINEEMISTVFRDCASYAYHGSWTEYGYADDPKVACWAISDSIRKMSTTW